MIDSFCCFNSFQWLDPVEGGVDYSYYNDKNGHYSLLDHMLVSPSLVSRYNGLQILAEDENISDHYGISFVCNVANVPSTKRINSHSDSGRLKYEWQKADLCIYRSCLDIELSKITLPVAALHCDGRCVVDHCTELNGYYRNIIHSLTNAANRCVPVKKQDFRNTGGQRN